MYLAYTKILSAFGVGGEYCISLHFLLYICVCNIYIVYILKYIYISIYTHIFNK